MQHKRFTIFKGGMWKKIRMSWPFSPSLAKNAIFYLPSQKKMAKEYISLDDIFFPLFTKRKYLFQNVM
jgi:hypothetical protein